MYPSPDLKSLCQLQHDPEKPAPDLIRGGSRFSEKIMLEQKSRSGWRFDERSSRSSVARIKRWRNAGSAWLMPASACFDGGHRLSLCVHSPLDMAEDAGNACVILLLFPS